MKFKWNLNINGVNAQQTVNYFLLILNQIVCNYYYWKLMKMFLQNDQWLICIKSLYFFEDDININIYL